MGLKYLGGPKVLTSLIAIKESTGEGAWLMRSKGYWLLPLWGEVAGRGVPVSKDFPRPSG